MQKHRLPYTEVHQRHSMKFVIEKISKSSGRLGHLVLSEASNKLKTPLLLQTTKGGSIPFLSREVFDHISKDAQMLQLSLATMDHMAEALTLYTGSLGSYVGFKDYPNLLTLRDPCETMPNGMNDKDMVPLFTRRGKEPLTAKRFMDLIEIFSPDIYQGLCDADTNYESSKKRVQKSVDRSQQFMEYCYERHKNSEKLKKIALFAPIVGGYNTFARSQSIQHSKTQPEHIISGYFFEGFHNYGLSATEVHVEKLLDVMKHCLKEMDAKKPKMMPGAYSPLAILELIRLGVDFFDSSYAYCASINFKALTFNFDLKAAKNCAANVLLDLTNENLKEDFSPLLTNCRCLACSKHTRAYVHHLYKTNELLGPILLMMHNLHHLLEFFETIRNCIECDTLPELIELIKYQSTQEEIDYHIIENKKEVSKLGLGKMFTSDDVIEAGSI